MSYPRVIRAACAVAALGVATAVAQVMPPKVTDIGPKPAEDRSSVGAVVTEDSMVRAQREALGFQRSSARTGVESVGRGVMRETLKQMGGPPVAARPARQADTFNRSADGEAIVQ